MTQRVTGTNNNYKVYARVRPIDYQQKMIECQSDNSISIKDPASKSKDKQTFSFNGVFDSSTTQDFVWGNVCEPVLQKVIEGHNSCIISYGQTGSGKTFTIFGEDERYSINALNLYVDGRKDKRGLICKTIEFLFKKAQELEDIREFVITCSVCEIYLDQVRDLGRAYLQSHEETNSKKQQSSNLVQNFESENLTIQDNSNGQIVIKDLSLITIKNINELYDLLSAAFQLREKFETKGNQIWARAHTIFTCNLVQKDKENENIPFMNSTIQFVDLAGSERIAKSLTEGHKFQEAILINSSLTALSKCLQQIAKSNKNIPYRESKLTKVLQNCMTFSSHTIIIANINPNESNYEECLASLQYAERSRNAQYMKGGGGQMDNALVKQQSTNQNNNGPTENQEQIGAIYNPYGGGDKKQFEQYKEQISDLKSKIEFANREHKEKMQKIQELLGIETDLDKVLNKQSQKELQQFKLQKEALVKLENLQKINQDQENKIERLHKVIDDHKKDNQINMERQQCIILEQREQIKRLKEQLSQNKMNSENEVQRINHERESELKLMIENSQQLLEEKAQKIINLPSEVEKKTRENNETFQKSKQKKYDLEKDYKQQIDNLKQEYAKLLETTKKQYEFFLQQKNEEMDTYVSQLKKYREKKKTEITSLQDELYDLYEIIQKQNKIIYRVENGEYSGGLRSFNIPNKDKPLLPSRQKHSCLYKILDQKHLSTTSEESKKSKKQSQQQQDEKVVTAETIQKQIQEKLEKTGEHKIYANPDDLVDIQFNINKLKDNEDFKVLKVYAERIKDSLQASLLRERELKDRVSQFDQINNNVDINSLLKEKDEYKNKYLTEMKKHNQSRIAIESQKRLLSAKFVNSPNHQSAVALIRPQTVQDRRFKSGNNFFPTKQ